MMQRSKHPHSRKRRAGFTLVEIMIVVLVIGILNLLATPAMNHVRRKAYATRIANDFRTFKSAFEIYATEQGTWPNSAGWQRIPNGMYGYINPGVWTSVMPGEGKWRWRRVVNPNWTRVRVMLRYPVKDAMITMQMVDDILDDGNLGTGQFVRNGKNYSYYLVDTK